MKIIRMVIWDEPGLTSVGDGFKLRADAARDFLSMKSAATNIDLSLISAYRICGGPGDNAKGVSSH